MGSHNRVAYSTRAMDSRLFVTICSIAVLLFGVSSEAYSCPETNVSFAGNDIFPDCIAVTKWQDCGKMCQLAPACKFWEFTTVKHCCLKTSDHGLKYREGFYAGAKDCPS